MSTVIRINLNEIKAIGLFALGVIGLLLGLAFSFFSKDSNDFVTVSIKDTGLGMTEKQLERIFDEFYRAHSTNIGVGSVGLGLSISKRIINNKRQIDRRLTPNA